jgi:hypothetical protein
LIVKIDSGKEGWSDYVLYGTAKKKRDPNKVHLIDGNIQITDAILEQTPYDTKYEKIVLSVKGKIGKDKMAQVYDEWKNLFFVGYDPSEYNICAVHHDDTNDDHIHILVNRMNLITNTQLHVYTHNTDLKRKDLIAQYLDRKYDLASPDDNRQLQYEMKDQIISEWRQEHLQKPFRLDSKKYIKETTERLAAYTIALQKEGLESLEELKDAYVQIGFDIVNEGYDNNGGYFYITVQNESGKTRLKGDPYGPDFWEKTKQEQRAQIINQKSVAPRSHINDADILLKELKTHQDKRMEALNKRYGTARKRSIAEFKTLGIDNIELNTVSEQAIPTSLPERPKPKTMPIAQHLVDRLNISLSTIADATEKNPADGYIIDTANNLDELAQLMKTKHYSAAQFLGNHRSAKNVTNLHNIIFFDIDNDPKKDKKLSKEEANQKIKEAAIVGLLVGSQSDGIAKKDSPAAERYRIAIPLKTKKSLPLDEIDKEVYKEYMRIIAEDLGILESVDKSALSDISRQYYPSTINADVWPIYENKLYNDSKALQEAKNIVQQRRDTIAKQLTQIKKYDKEISDLYVNSNKTAGLIDINMYLIGQLDIKQIIKHYETVKDYDATSSSEYEMLETDKAKYSILKDSTIAYDFKSGKKYNAIHYVREQFGNKETSFFDVAKKLEEITNEQLITINRRVLKDMAKQAISTSTSDLTFKNNLKSLTKARFINFDLGQQEIELYNHKFSFQELDINKKEMIQKFKENREKSVVKDD